MPSLVIKVWPFSKSIEVLATTEVNVPAYVVLPTIKFFSFNTKFVLLPFDTNTVATTSIPYCIEEYVLVVNVTVVGEVIVA